MAVDVQEFRLQVTGQQQSSQKLNRFGSSMQTLEQRADAARGRIGGAAGAIGNVGTIMSQTNPVVGAFAGVIGTAGSAIEALTAAVGGPWAIALGAATAALGLFVTNTALAKEEQEEFNKEVQEGTKSLDEFISKVEQRRSQRALESRLRLGIDPTELQARLDQLQSELRETEVDIRESREVISDTTNSYELLEQAHRSLDSSLQLRNEIQTRIRQTEEKLNRAQEEQRQLVLDKVEREEREKREAEREKKKTGATATPSGPTTEDFRVQGRFLTVPEQAGAGRPGAPPAATGGKALQARGDVSGLGTDILRAQDTFGQTSDIKKQEEILQAREEREQKAMQRRLDAAREAAAEEQQLAQQVAGTWQDASTTMATSLGSAVTALIQGNDEALGAILQNIGTQSIAQGTQAVLRAAVSAAFGNPAAGAQAAAGGALIAFGATLGGAGGAAGGGAGGAARPTAPQQSQTFQSGSLAPGNTTINFYGIATRETGEQVVAAQRQLKRERGSQAVKV